jgi:hypothetical protein
MNAKLILTENNVQLYEAELLKLGYDLGRAIDARSEQRINLIEHKIKEVQGWLKEEMELLDELKQELNYGK